MSGFPTLILALAAGLALGLFYFGGLWLTVRRLPGARRPTLLFVASFVGRTALTLLGFYLIMDGSWDRMLACLLGVIIARQVLVFRLRPDRGAATGEREGVQP